MDDLVPTLLVSVAGAILAAVCSTGFSSREKRWVAIAFAMHVAFACVQVPLTLSFYGGGDMFLYFRYGETLARMMERDPLHVVPEVTALLLQRPHRLPFEVIGAGASTGSMSALAAWAFYVIGPSKYAASTAFAMLSLSGKVAMYRVFRANIDDTRRGYAALATLFVPSFVFWSAGMIKEAIALTGFGWSLLGLHLWIRDSRSLRGVSLVAGGAVPMLLIKPYILFPFVLAGGGWYYAKRSLNRGRVRIRPLYLAAAALLSIGGIVVLGHYFPEYSVDVFSSRTAELQRLGRVVRGGSSYELASEVPTTLAGQFAYAPAALLSALFRPSLFEVHNMLMLANAMETTLLTLLVIRILFTRNLDGVRQQILREPFLIFCLVFIVAFGLAVGLASTNLGTLSRYRAPLLPFFVLLILVLTRPAQMREATSESKNDAVAARRATPMAFGVPVRENGSMPYEVRSQRWNDGRKS